jgi:PAS domain S-box-containing protein
MATIIPISQHDAFNSTKPAGGFDGRFCEVLDAAPIMIWVSGQDKGCVWFNQPWLAFTGRNMAQEVGEGWAQGVHRGDLDACLKTYTSHFDARKEFRMQYRLCRHDGAYRWIDDVGIPRFSADGTFVGYIGSCIDIHDYRETQAELRRRLLEIAQLNRRAETAVLGASIAHEISQPVAAVITRASAGLRWLARKTPDVSQARAELSAIVRNGHRMIKLIDSVRAMLKRESQSGVPISLNDVIREVLLLLESDLQLHHIAVRTVLDESLPKVRANRVQVEQLLFNLIRNAIEAMDPVTASSRELLLRTEVDDTGNLIIVIQDSGTGIDLENIDRIFDPFFTTKSQGLGMGLSICRSIVEAHHGRLWVEPRAHQGSTFRISFPMSLASRKRNGSNLKSDDAAGAQQA